MCSGSLDRWLTAGRTLGTIRQSYVAHRVHSSHVLQDQQALGANNTDPKWAVAWKPAAEVAVTQLRDITVSVGRSGAPPHPTRTCTWLL